MRRGSKYLNNRQRQDGVTYYTDNPMMEWEKIQQIASGYKDKNLNYICSTVYTGEPYQTRMYPLSCFSKVIEHEFEKINVKIPIEYDKVLTIGFGNYMSFPPVESRGCRHSDMIFDPDEPYTTYLE